MNIRNTFRITALGLLLGTATVTLAHPDHGPQLTGEDRAVDRAIHQVERLATEGKIEASWKESRTLVSADLKAAGDKKEWVVIFTNEQATDPAKRKLFVYLSEHGSYVAANFTGK
jgi:hypothetical protein